MKKKINILVPTDFSPNAQRALDYAIKVGERFNSKIILLNAYLLPPTAGDMPAEVMDKEIRVIGDAESTKMKSLLGKARVQSPGTDFSSVVEYGMINNEISRMVDENNIDLVVLGSQGISAVEAALFGSVTLSTIENATCPVVVVPENAEATDFSKIVYASSLSEEDIRGLNDLGAWAKAFDAEVTVVHISSPEDRQAESRFSDFERKVKRLVDYPKLKFCLIWGKEVVKAMNDYVMRENPGLLVMLTYPRMPFESLYHPSTTRKVTMHARVPLMVFHESK